MSEIAKSLCLQCLPFLLSIVLITLIIPSLALIYFLFFLYRQIVIRLAALFKKESLGKILSTRSSILITEKIYDNPQWALVSFLLVEGVVNIQHLRETFRKKVLHAVDPKLGNLLYPELQQNVTNFLGFPFWRRLQNFDRELDELISFQFGNEHAETNTQMALAFMKLLCFKPFSEDKPLWEIIILPNFKPDPNFHTGILSEDPHKYSGVIIRCHHALADGASQLGLVQALSTSGKRFNFIQATDYTQQIRGQSRFPCFKLLHNLKLLFQIPFALSTMAARRLILLRPWTELKFKNIQKSQEIHQSVNEAEWLLNENQKVQKQLSRFSHYQSHNFPLSEISEIRDIVGTGVGVTSILYAAMVAAARDTLFMELSKIPENILIISPLPLPGAGRKLRNHITMGSIIAPVSEQDSITRLKKIHKRLDSLKHSATPIVHAVLMKVVGSLPSCLVELTNRIVGGGNLLMISNVAGPRGQCDFVGYLVKDFLNISGAAVGTGSITISLISICGNIRMGVAADVNIIESDKKCRQFTENFFKELSLLKQNGNYEAENI